MAVAAFGRAPAEVLRGGFQDGAQAGVVRFLRRKSSGSIFTAAASSSMCDSRAKWLAVEASAR